MAWMVKYGPKFRYGVGPLTIEREVGYILKVLKARRVRNVKVVEMTKKNPRELYRSYRGRKMIAGVATKVYPSEGSRTTVRLYNTDIVSFRLSPDGNHGEAILRSGGYETVTTKTRINQTALSYAMPFRVTQKAREWTVTVAGRVVPFMDGMTISW